MRYHTMILILAILAILSVASFIIFRLFFWGNGMGHGYMMGQSLWPILTIVPLVAALIVILHATAFPEIERQKKNQEVGDKQQVFTNEKPAETIETILNVLQDDEKKVLEILLNEGGTMLQRDITRKAGYSKVKTHRILFRLSKRKIVTAEKHYNTNKITVAEWLLKNR